MFSERKRVAKKYLEGQFLITLSPLCLFDPEAEEWSHDDLIAFTTIPWAADWLACYEGWLASGRWYGGGRHGRAQFPDRATS
jgi:hypothetical protein